MGEGTTTRYGGPAVTVSGTFSGASVLVVAGEATLRRALAREIVDRGGEALTAADRETSITLLTSRSVDVAVLDASLADGVLGMIHGMRALDPQLEVVLAIREELVDEALTMLSEKGALARLDVVVMPVPSPACWVIAIDRALERRRLERTISQMQERQAGSSAAIEMLGTSVVMRELQRVALGIAPTTTPVLIEGECGTGKERLARLIHAGSRRSAHPFVVMSCAAIPTDHMEEVLFGTATRPGLIDEADRGTLVLDHVEELPLSTQGRLCQWLAEAGARAVSVDGTVDGTVDAIRGRDVRWIATSLMTLRAAIKAGRFREELFYRLSVVPLLMPPLRRRRDDIPLLAHHFLRNEITHRTTQARRIGAEAMRALRAYPWPGNVRELEINVVHAAEVARGETLVPGDFSLRTDGSRVRAAGVHDEQDTDDLALSGAAHEKGHAVDARWLEMSYAPAKDLALETFHRAYLEGLLTRAGGNVSEAARQAGLDRSNFRRILRATGLGGRKGGEEGGPPASS